MYLQNDGPKQWRPSWLSGQDIGGGPFLCEVVYVITVTEESSQSIVLQSASV